MSEPSQLTAEGSIKSGKDTTTRNEARLRLKSFYQLKNEREASTNSSSDSQTPARSNRSSVFSPISSAFNNVFKTTTRRVSSQNTSLPNSSQQPSEASSRVTDRKGKAVTRSGASSATIGSQNFNSKAYLRHALRDKPVKGLLELDNQLVSDIKNIDSDMKTMLYENYSQFISATDAIKQVNQNLGVMDNEMTKLTKKVDGMVSRATVIAAPLAQRSQKIHKLASTHKLLLKLQFLYDVPNQLSAYISRGELTEAAQLWARAQPLFDRYRQLGAFAGLERDGKALVSNIETAVWGRWKDPNTDLIEGAECAALLVMLSPERVGDIWSSYIEIQTEKLLNLRDKLSKAATNTPGVPTFIALSDPSDSIHVSKIAPQRVRPTRVSSMVENGMGTRKSVRGSFITHASEPLDPLLKFNDEFLPMWNGALLGFLIQFTSPDSQSDLEECIQSISDAQIQAEEGKDANSGMQQKASSLISLFAPSDYAKKLSSAPPSHPLVPAWQMMSPEELGQAQQALRDAVVKWHSIYEQAVLPILLAYTLPAQGESFVVKPVDDLIHIAKQYPLLVQAGRFGITITRAAQEWQGQLLETALGQLTDALVEKVSEYFEQTPPLPNDGRAVVSKDGDTLSRFRNCRVARPHSFSSSTYLTQHLDANGEDNAALQYRSCSPRGPMPPPVPNPQIHRRATSSASSPSLEVNTRSQRSQSFKASNNSDVFSESFSKDVALKRHKRMGSGPLSLKASSPSRQTSNPPMPSSPMLRNMKPPTIVFGEWSPKEFLTKLETWFIEQILSNLSPLLESVAQHYNDCGSAFEGDSDEPANPASANTAALSTVYSRLLTMLVLTTKDHLNKWLIERIPGAFYKMADIDGSLSPDATYSQSRDAKTPLSVSFESADDINPLATLLLSQLCIDFEQSLTRNIYQFCEQALVVSKEQGSNLETSRHSSRTNSIKESPAANSASLKPEKQLGQETELGESIVVSLESDILAEGHHERYDPIVPFVLDIKTCSDSWNVSAQTLAQAYIRKVGYRLVLSFIEDVSHSSDIEDDLDAELSVSQHWIELSKELKKIEADVNDLFYDPIFSSVRGCKIKPTPDGATEQATTPTKMHPLTQYRGKIVRNPSGSGLDPGSPTVTPGEPNSNAEESRDYFFSTIDELFGEHIDDQPLKVEDLKAGNIMTHISLIILKAAIKIVGNPTSDTNTIPEAQRFSSRDIKQSVIDAVFAKVWMSRYAGLSPSFSATPVTSMAKSKKGLLNATPRYPYLQIGHPINGNSNNSSGRPVNEPALRSIQRLVDEWIQATSHQASIMGMGDDIPDAELVNGIVSEAYNSTSDLPK